MALNLTGISDDELIGRLKQMVAKEREVGNRILLHLAEVDRRRLFADLGHTSMYDYVTRRLGYSRSAGQRRILCCRVLQKFPEVYECLEDGRISLSVLELVAGSLDKPHAEKLLQEVIGKSIDEAERIASLYTPVSARKLVDRIEPVAVVKDEADEDRSLSLFESEENSSYSRSGVNGKLMQESLEIEAAYRITFAAGERVREKLERAKELLGPGRKLEDVLEAALDEYLKHKCPEARMKRRMKRLEQQASVRTMRDRDLEEIEQRWEEKRYLEHMKDLERAPEKRFITGKLRDEVLARDEFCCTFVAGDGTKCCARAGLEIDHILPWSYGGKAEPSNLRTLCKTHNLMYARKVFGEIEAKFAEASP